MKIDHAAILAGGFGKRLGEITKKTPKPLIKINDLEFIKYLIFDLIKNNFKKIIILTNYKSYKFEKIFNKLSFPNIKIICLKEKKKLGTGGSIAQLKKFKKDFLVINGDSYLNFDLKKFLSIKKNCLAKMMLVKNSNYKSNSKLSNLDLNKDFNVTFSTKNIYMNAGIYLLKKQLLNKLRINNFSLENDILPKFIKEGQVDGLISKNDFIDIGLKKNLKKAALLLKKKFKLKAVLFDRDGTLNKNYGYVHKIENFKWLKGAKKTIEFLTFFKIKSVVITNQSGIGRGLYSFSDFLNLNKEINKALQSNKAKIDKFYYAPYYKFSKIKKYKKNFHHRKPNNGMIIQAMNEYGLTSHSCFMIGDKISDLVAAKKSKIKFYKKERNSLFNQIIKNLHNFHFKH